MIFPMTPEEKALLERTAKLVEENNAILQSIRRSNRFTTALHILYWVVIIVFSFGAYYFIQPYLTMLLGVTDQAGGVQGIMNSLNNAPDAANSLKDLLK